MQEHLQAQETGALFGAGKMGEAAWECDMPRERGAQDPPLRLGPPNRAGTLWDKAQLGWSRAQLTLRNQDSPPQHSSTGGPLLVFHAPISNDSLQTTGQVG